MKHKVYEIPTTFNRETLLAFLEEERCIIRDRDCGVSRCYDCIFATLGLTHATKATKYQSIIEYGLSKDLLSKGEALKFTLDKNTN